jgi:hypothetical protein
VYPLDFQPNGCDNLGAELKLETTEAEFPIWTRLREESGLGNWQLNVSYSR